jgi:hypothetical protein
MRKLAILSLFLTPFLTNAQNFNLETQYAASLYENESQVYSGFYTSLGFTFTDSSFCETLNIPSCTYFAEIIDGAPNEITLTDLINNSEYIRVYYNNIWVSLLDSSEILPIFINPATFSNLNNQILGEFVLVFYDSNDEITYRTGWLQDCVDCITELPQFPRIPLENDVLTPLSDDFEFNFLGSTTPLQIMGYITNGVQTTGANTLPVAGAIVGVPLAFIIGYRLIKFIKVI